MVLSHKELCENAEITGSQMATYAIGNTEEMDLDTATQKTLDDLLCAFDSELSDGDRYMLRGFVGLLLEVISTGNWENEMTNQATTSDLLKAAGKVADIAGRITGEGLGGSVTGVSIVEMPGLLHQLKVAVAEYNAIVLQRSQQGCP